MPSLHQTSAQQSSTPAADQGQVAPQRQRLSTATSRRCSIVDLDIPDRAVSAFIGPSGCGKSTFLRCINRMNDTIPMAAASTGKIEIDGEDIYDRDLDVVQLRARVGMVFQKPNPFPKSIYENVAYGPRIHGLASSKADLDEIVVTSLQEGRPVRGGEGPPACSRAPASPAASSSACASPAPLRSTPRSS